jgi:hypothetical protein
MSKPARELCTEKFGLARHSRARPGWQISAHSKCAEAQPLYKKALTMFRRLLSDDHSQTAKIFGVEHTEHVSASLRDDASKHASRGSTTCSSFDCATWSACRAQHPHSEGNHEQHKQHAEETGTNPVGINAYKLVPCQQA